VEKGNLLVVDLAPFYISALMHDIKPFEKAKKLFAENAENRKDRHVRFVDDGTGFLFKNKHFDECAVVEQWWQEKPFEGSYVCPFPNSFFNTFPHDIYSKRVVVATHDIVVNAFDDSLLEEAQSNKHQQQLSLYGQIEDSNIQKTRLGGGEPA
jgi:hypothetical protein